MPEEVIVAGAGFGGLSSAISLAEKGFDVKLIDQERVHTYKPGLPGLIRDKVGREKLRLDLHDFVKGTPVEFVEEKILRIDPEENRIETGSGSHVYDDLVLSLGGKVKDFGIDISGVEKCYTLSQAESLSEKAGEADDAVVVGAGYVGVEIAAELSEKGLDVTVLDQITRPMPNSPEQSSQMALDYMNENDISFKAGRKVVDISGGELVTGNGESIEAEMVVWATGVKCSDIISEFLGCTGRGIEVNSGLSCKDYEDIFAVGDCADHGFEKNAQNSIKMGRVAAENIARGEGQPLESFESGSDISVISLGNTAILEYKGSSYVNFLFRYMKSMIRRRYWAMLKKKRWMLKLPL